MPRKSFKPWNMLYPLPAVMVSCQIPGEKPDIITVAWAGTVCSDPAMVSVSIRPERFSHGIISQTGEFVINLVNEQLTRSMDYCGVRSGREIDKAAECGLHLIASEKVQAPSIAESPVCIECRVVQTISLGSHDMFLAKVEAVTVDERLMEENGKFRLNSAGLTAYSHGEYFSLGKKLGSFGYSVRKKPLSGKPKGRAEKSTAVRKGKDQSKEGRKNDKRTDRKNH